ncbi:MAG: cytidine deaminase [Rubricoccaceae bacterium]
MSEALRAIAQFAADHAYAPYSRAPAAVALLLSDGTVVTGARMENASYPLTIPALQAAWARARAAGRQDFVAAAASRPFEPAELAFLRETSRRDWTATGFGLATVQGLAAPEPSALLSPFMDRTRPASDAAGLALALEAASRAAAVVSRFPVGCVLELADGRLVAGANVEHPSDWTRGLCAERVALSAALVGHAEALRRIYLACPHAPGATPCGGCRQVLAERAPGVPVVLWQGEGHAPVQTTPEALLPGAFAGADLRRAPA